MTKPRVILCAVCKKRIERTPHMNNVKFCSTTCRNKTYQKRMSAWQRARYDQLASIKDDDKIQCKICGRWYVQVGGHIAQRHDMTAREYREYFNMEVSKGIIPAYYKALKGELALGNGTYKNLTAGAGWRYKFGDPRAGRYVRSPITVARLRVLHKFRKGVK